MKLDRVLNAACGMVPLPPWRAKALLWTIVSLWIVFCGAASADGETTGWLLVRGELALAQDGTHISQRLTPNVNATSRAFWLYDLYQAGYNSYLEEQLANAPCSASDSVCRGNYAISRFSAFNERIGALTPDSPSDGRILGYYHHLLGQQNLNDALAELRSQAGNPLLNEEEFLTAVQILGLRAGLIDYNFPRANGQGPDSGRILDANRVLSAAGHNTALGWNSVDPMRESTYEFTQQVQWGGVCREISVTMARLLEARGFGNVRVIGYESLPGGHATVLAGSISAPGTYHLLNYPTRFTRAGRDSAELLAQGADDYTNIYRVYNAQGNFLGMVPSTTGLLLNEASGMNNQQWYPLARVRGSLIAGGVQTNLSDRHHLSIQTRVFFASDGNGTPIIGMGTHIHLGTVNSLLEVGTGGALAVQIRSPQTTGDGGRTSQALLYYGAGQVTVRTPPANLAPGLTARVAATGLFSGSGHVLLTSPAAGVAYQQSVNQIGLVVDIRHSVRGVDSRLESGLYGSIRYANIQGPPYGLSAPQGRFRYTVGAPLGPLRALGEFLFVVDGQGPRALGEIGIEHPFLPAFPNVAVGLSGRLVTGDGLTADGTLRRFHARIRWQPIQRLQIGGQVTIPLEGTSEPNPERPILQGTVEGRFKNANSPQGPQSADHHP